MRLALRIAAALLAIVLLLVIAAVAFLQTEAGGRAAARALSLLASTPGQAEVRIEEMGPGFPGRITLSGLSVADQEGEWLAVDLAEVRWRPSALLKGELSIADASAAGVRLSRLPKGAPEADAEEGELALPRLPLDLRVDRFAFDNVEIGPAVAGEALALRASGKIAAEREGGLSTEADIVRTNGAGGAFRLATLWQPRGEQLSVDLRADEPEGGLIGGALGLAGRPRVRLSFSGDGPLREWRGRLDGSIGEEIRVLADVACEETPVGTQVRLSGDAEVAALLPEAAQALAGDGIDFGLTVRQPTPRVLAIDAARVSAEGVELAAAGGLLLDDQRFDDVRLTLAVTDATALAPLLAPAGVEAAQIQVDVSGPWRTPTATVAAGLVGLGTPDASVAGMAVQASLVAEDGGQMRVEAEAMLTGVRAAGADVDAALGAPPRLRLGADFDLQGETLAFDAFELLTPVLNATARGAYELGSGAGRMTLRALASDLGAFSALAGIDLAGSVAFAADARVAAGAVEASLGLASSGLRSGVQAADALLGPAPTMRAAVRMDLATGEAKLEHLLVTGDGMRATAEAALKDGLASGAYHVDVPDVAPAAAAAGVAASGALALEGSVGGAISDPEAEAVLTFADGGVAGVVASPARVELTAKSLATGPRGLLVATASAAGGPLRLAVPFDRDERDSLRLGPIEGSGAGARLTGGLKVPSEGGAVLGTLALVAGGAGQPVALAGHRLDGCAEVRVKFGERNGEQTVEVTGSGRSLALSTPDGQVGGVGSLSLRANVAGTADPRGDVTLSLVRPAAAGVALAGIDARLTGSPADARYEITARLADDPAEVLQAHGAFTQENGRSRLSVASLDGQAGGNALALRRPLTITEGGGETALADLELSVAGGSITGGGRTGASGTDGRLVLGGLPLTLARALKPDLNLTGTLNGEAVVRTEGSDLAGRIELDLSGVRGGAMGQAPPLEANAVATLGGGRAALQVRVPRLGGSPLTLDASVPARVDARTLAVDVAEQAPLEGRLVWAGAVARLWELAPLPEQRLTGDATVDLTLGGTVAVPAIGGEAALTNGRYEHFLTETVIDGLTLQARSTGAGGVALTLRGTDGGNGTVSGDGRVKLAKGMAPWVELALAFAEATLVRRDDVNATLSGAMTFRQDASGASLAGEITSDRIEIRLIDRLPPSVVVLDVTEINLPPGRAPSRAAPPPDPGPGAPAIALDIGVKLPRRVFVRGRGLESEWQGDLRVSGSSADPRLVGTVEVRSGTFDFAGKRFSLEAGEIGFAGGATVDPTLNVRAVRTTPELTATIRVTGTALDPEIELASTPALPESEILSRVLFDKGVAKLGPVEAAQLAMALDTLASGESMSEDALSYVRNLLGLDVLTIEAGEEEGEGPALGVGRYVAEGVYVGARQGVAEESTAGTVEIEVLPGLAIESEVSEGAEGATGALGLRWKWDY